MENSTSRDQAAAFASATQIVLGWALDQINNMREPSPDPTIETLRRSGNVLTQLLLMQYLDRVVSSMALRHLQGPFSVRSELEAEQRCSQLTGPCSGVRSKGFLALGEDPVRTGTLEFCRPVVGR